MSCNKEKAPTAVLDYQEDWTTWLAASSPADTIATSVWTADNGMVVDSDINTDSVATVWLSGGRLGAYAIAENTITTAGGRTDARQLVVEIKNRQ